MPLGYLLLGNHCKIIFDGLRDERLLDDGAQRAGFRTGEPQDEESKKMIADIDEDGSAAINFLV